MPPSDDRRPEPSPAGAPRPAAATPPRAAIQQRAVAGLFLALLSLAGLLGLNNLSRGIYVVLYALAAGAVALWLAVTAMTGARRERTARPRGSVTAVVIAALGVTISGVLLLAFAMFGSQLSVYGRCLSGANTISTQQSCQSQFTHAVTRQLGILRR